MRIFQIGRSGVRGKYRRIRFWAAGTSRNVGKIIKKTPVTNGERFMGLERVVPRHKKYTADLLPDNGQPLKV